MLRWIQFLPATIYSLQGETHNPKCWKRGLGKNAFYSSRVMWSCCIWCLKNTSISYACAFACIHRFVSMGAHVHAHTHTLHKVKVETTSLSKTISTVTNSLFVSINHLHLPVLIHYITCSNNLSGGTVPLSIVKSEFLFLLDNWTT